jgi:hypothetical protein
LRKRHKPEEIVSKLRQLDVLLARCLSVAVTLPTLATHPLRLEEQSCPITLLRDSLETPDNWCSRALLEDGGLSR